ncbi:MAG: hypothetical protein IT210_24760 [Armatimonadetes bacterium]|nr:hypothetical protein [Armatimonadota bacterium]
MHNAKGVTIPGNAFLKSISIDRNRTVQEVQWYRGPDLPPLAGVPVRLHFELRSANLFIFQFIA